MKIKVNYLFIFLFTLITSCSNDTTEESESALTKQRIVVMTDFHYFDRDALLINPGSAFDAACGNNNVVTYYTKEILDAQIKRISDLKPDWLFVLGDVTFSGEKVNHQVLMSRYLQPLIDKGVKIYMCPGNHDIKDPNSFKFDGDQKIPVDNITAKEFEQIYSACGFNEAYSRDNNSLSYSVRPCDGIGLLSIDAAEYGPDRSKRSTGFISPETLSWMAEQAALLQAEGREVLTIMHYPILNHYKNQKHWQDVLIIDHAEEYAKAFSDMGIHFVFTGHAHSQNITQRDGDYFFDILTGSLTSCESPYRVIDLNPSTGEISIYSESLRSADAPFDGFREYAYKIAGTFSYVFGEIHTGKDVSQEVKDQVTNFAFDATISHARGDERLDPAKRAEIEDYTKQHPEVKEVLEDAILGGLYTDLTPSDNRINFNYIKKSVQNH
ncbi:MAG: metallophosphoesterase family protein [Phocaeicola sp.]